MTAQLDDYIIIDSKEFNVSKTSHGLIFNPKKAFGVEGMMSHTGCWRGYQAIYAIRDTQLIVQTLKINIEHAEYIDGRYVDKPIPIIEGVKSVPSPYEFGFRNIYEGIDYQVFYSGGVIAHDDYLGAFGVRFYPFPLSDYGVIIELIFEDGKLVHFNDHTAAVAQFRKRFPPLEEGGRAPTEEEARKFNEKTFAFEYKCHIPFGLEL